MFIKNEDFRELIAIAKGEAAGSPAYIACLEADLQRSEQRERERREQKRMERLAFYRRLYNILAEEPGRKLCPTDIQFMIFRRTGEQLSCQKIAQSLCRMAWADRQDNLPTDMRGVQFSTPRSYNARKGDTHTYYWVTK